MTTTDTVVLLLEDIKDSHTKENPYTTGYKKGLSVTIDRYREIIPNFTPLQRRDYAYRLRTLITIVESLLASEPHPTARGEEYVSGYTAALEHLISHYKR